MPTANQRFCETCATWLLDTAVEAHIDANTEHVIAEKQRFVPIGEAKDDITGSSEAPPTPDNASQSLPVLDSIPVVMDPADNTKLVRIDAGSVATGTTRVLTMPDADVTPVDTADSRLSDDRNDADAIHDNVASEISALSLVTAVAGDHVLVEDASDSNNKKRVLASDFLGGGGPPQTLGYWEASGHKPPATDPARFVERNGVLYLAYDDTTVLNGMFVGKMPQKYTGGNLELIVRYIMDTATSGDVDLGGAWERRNDGGTDLDTDSFATAQTTLNTTVPTTAGEPDSITISFTSAQIDGTVVGDDFRIRIQNLAAGTASGDLHLVSVELREIV